MFVALQTGAFMKTEWELIRTMMNTAIDSCEQIEAMGYSEQAFAMPRLRQAIAPTISQ
jgi:hypothetical protein